MEAFNAHLRTLEVHQVNIWYADQTLPGTQWERERDRRLQSAHLILLLVSADFINSEHYERIVLLAMERYKRGEARVVPVILRPVYWQGTSFGSLGALPEGGKPITDPDWKTLDHAFFNVVCAIKRIVNDEKHLDSHVITRLEQIIQDFKLLRKQITDAARLKASQGSSVESCERQYNRLYGDTMVFLETYLPQVLSDKEEGFVEAVYREAMAQLQQRNNFSVWLTRQVFTPLAKLEKLAAQIDASVPTLESYKEKYFL